MATRRTPKVCPVTGTGLQGKGNAMCAHSTRRMFAAAIRTTSAARPSAGKILSARTLDCDIRFLFGILVGTQSYLAAIIPDGGGLLRRLFAFHERIIGCSYGSVLVCSVNFAFGVKE